MSLKHQLKLKYLLVLNYIGLVLVFNGLVLLLPLVILPLYSNEISHAKAFLTPSIISFSFGLLIFILSKNKYGNSVITVSDGGIIVVAAWILSSLISSIPFYLEGTLNFTQSLFESVSGWTTTGLSVVDVSKAPHIFLFWRSIMQMLGGIGFAIVFLASIIGNYGRGIYNAEGRTDLLLPNLAKSAKLIMIIYFGYILGGVFLYYIAGMPLFDAINHSMAALSTGGFSTMPNSIGEYDNVFIELISIVLMFAGTINFAAHFLILKGEFSKFIKIGEIKFMFFLLSVMIPVVGVFSLKSIYVELGKTVRVSIFELVSALTTTGFSTVNYSNWDEFSIFALIVLMLIGGGTGSTAGGIKQFRIYVLSRAVTDYLKGFFLPPNRVKELDVIKPEGRVFLRSSNLNEINMFIFVYLFVYLIGVCILTLNGYSLRLAMFEFASSLGTVGLSVGVTSSSAPGIVLWTEIIGMFIGRLEIFVVMFAVIKVFKDIKIIARNPLE
jgi:trk system potassium uptake protein TrkH